jgi:single-strand DNA-binding protein
MNRNRIEIIGRVGQQPEILTFDNGGKIAKFSMATNDNYKNKKGEKIEQTDWHNIVVSIPKLVDIAEKYINKGDQVGIVGKNKTRSYGDENNKKYITEIYCLEISLFSSKKPETSGSNHAPSPEPQSVDFASTFGDDDDDLPF